MAYTSPGQQALEKMRQTQDQYAAPLAPITMPQTNASGTVKPAPPGKPKPPTVAGAPKTYSGPYDANRFASVISGVESGGNYNAVNRHSGARGKYQIMPGNWAGWSRAAGLPAGADWSPQNQERVALYKFGEYLNKYGPEGAAVAWYAGEGTAQAYVRNPNDSRWDRPQSGYPSIRSYARKVTGAY